MKILAIESSCDESSVAVVENRTVLSLCTRTQEIHEKFGGVVPELAGRTHLELLPNLAQQAIEQSGCSFDQINCVAVTRGPGLVGSLLVGLNFARGLARGLNIPLRTVHHIEAHLWSAEMDREPIPLPFLALIVSGGHTLLVIVRGLRQYEIIGSTLDDAVGEAFDKVGKLLGLSFPAGAAMDQLAGEGDASLFPLPTLMKDESFNFSFSGLKTAVLYRLNSQRNDQLVEARNVAAAFQKSAVDSILTKCERALNALDAKAMVCAGGVAANSLLRSRLGTLASNFHIPCFIPSLKYCADNAAMIGYLATKLNVAKIGHDSDDAIPRWPLTHLSL